MFRLILVSVVWAFSFVLVKEHLDGPDPSALATARLVLALAVFLPFLRWRAVAPRQAALLTAIGAVQFGVMYAFYMAAFPLLQAAEVALFTVFTPVFVMLLDALLERRAAWRWFAAAALAVAGTGVVFWHRADYAELWRGFLLMQASNACFAFGQLAYKRLRPSLPDADDKAFFAWLMLGGAAAALAWTFAAGTDWPGFFAALSTVQWGVLVYLGAIASGVCFLLWNQGATQVNAGVLAVFNNLKLPLGVACALVFAWVASGSAPKPETLARLALSATVLTAALCLCRGRR
jgi:drug/metabolite transporter (DMT)-like permease